MNNSGVKTTEGIDNSSISFNPNNTTGSGSLFNQNPPLTPLSKPIKVPLDKDGFKAGPNPAFNPSYISQALGINGTTLQAQYNKSIYQPIIYQPYLIPVVNNAPNMGMNQYGMMPQFPGMMMGYPQFPGMMMGYPQFPGMMMGYPQFPGMMMAYQPLAGPDLTQQYQPMPQQTPQEANHSGQEKQAHDDGSHFAIMNPDLMKHQHKDDGDFGDFNDDFDDDIAPFSNPNSGGNDFDSDFNTGSNFGQLNPNFGPANNFNDQGPSFGPTPDFNAAPSFNTPSDFNSTSEFNPNGAGLGQMEPVKMPFAQGNNFNQRVNNANLEGYDEDSEKQRLPIWAIVLIVILAVLIVAVVVIVMLYFNLQAVHDLINGWFGLDVPFDPWFLKK
ncbi:hypothetical protein [Spiroplasma poulsonii]|uniref:Uncharacterized protein n=1 Tax=Spiroplasma poulsonii TaxID=2138 RepID=A0A2P6FBV2_9MOLU|nr:hypothetical protein [Spiroplasma poulsonii]KAF0851346.1 hypothetical protein MSROBK_007680 [Spiroplasma poulsonii]PQM30939.1 hypothetical protein SMSRO_SF007320 [Spiroplasma poulsonii]PWF95933.1 hypothetical protein SMSE_13700 [Spiroplasma poulsonii]PWF98709.1 hypothetical protein SMH99_12710 [Spiroplasma poulsonii]